MYTGCIYRHWIINDKGEEKSYIGKHAGDNPAKGRWCSGKGYLKKGGKHKFARAIKKYGWDNFSHEIIGWCEAEDIDELNFMLSEWEKYFIYKYNSYCNGYNSTLGGEGTVGLIMTPEHRKHISEAKKGKVAYYPTEEQRKAKSVMFSGAKHPMYGKHWDEEHRANQSIKMKGKMVGEKHPQYGKPRTDETKKKISEKVSGEKHPLYGTERPEETRRKIGDSRKGKGCGDEHPLSKKVVCLETNEVFNTIKEANKKYKCNLGGKFKEPNKIVRSGKHPDTGEKLSWMLYKDWLGLQK